MKNDKIEYTTVGELIELLKHYEQDMPVCINGRTPAYLSQRPFYYDGGYVAKDVNDHRNYIRSRSGSDVTPGFHFFCLDIMSTGPLDYEDGKLDGRPVREIDPESHDYLDKMEQEERLAFDGQLVKYE